VTLSERQAIFALNVAKLITYIFESGFKCTLGEAFRTTEQAKLYAAQGKGIANSLHRSRVAIDLNLFSPEGVYLTDSKDYEQFGKYWELLHKDNRSGCFWKKTDGNHFEMQKSHFGSLKKQ